MISPVFDDAKGSDSSTIVTSSICFFEDKYYQRIQLRITSHAMHVIAIIMIHATNASDQLLEHLVEEEFTSSR